MNPIGDKVMRMATVSPIIEEGRVYLPNAAPWLEAFRNEVMAFRVAAMTTRWIRFRRRLNTSAPGISGLFR